MDEAFIRKDILQDAVKVSGNLSNQLSIEHNRIVATFTQFRHKVTRQRVFCIIISQINWYFIINTLVDLNPKPLISCSASTFNKFELQLTISDSRNCNIKFYDKKSFLKWQKCCSEAIAEALCCEAMKPLVSGRLSLTRMNRCLHTCNTLTRNCPLIIQVKRLRSIRNKINQTMKELIAKKAIIPESDILKMKASFNFVQYIYPSMQQDPDLQFLTTKLCNKDENSTDLEELCKLLLHIDQEEDKIEFINMIRQSKPSPCKKMSINNTNTSTILPLPLSPRKRSVLKSNKTHLSPSKIITKHHVSWDCTVKSNEKRKQSNRQPKSPLQVRTPSGGKENINQNSIHRINTQQSPKKSILPQHKVQKDIQISTPIATVLQQTGVSDIVPHSNHQEQEPLHTLNSTTYTNNTSDATTAATATAVMSLPIAVAARSSPRRGKYKPNRPTHQQYYFYTYPTTVVLCTTIVLASLLFWSLSSLTFSTVRFGVHSTELSTLTLSMTNTASITPTSVTTVPPLSTAYSNAPTIATSTNFYTTDENNHVVTKLPETIKHPTATALKLLTHTVFAPLRWVKTILYIVRNYINRLMISTKKVRTI